MSSNAVVRSAICHVIQVTLWIVFVGIAPSHAAPFSTDRQLNFTVPGCNCAGGVTPSQYAPSVAAWGPYVLASWYDQRYRCLGPGQHPAQSWGYSTDYGATFTDKGFLVRPNGTVFFGNPSVAVNGKTGNFYVVGYGRPPTGNPIFALKGHFQADTFAIDTTVTVASPDPSNFYERPWVAVDSVTGSVHVIWMNYEQDASTEIEYQKLDAGLHHVGPELVLQETRYGGYTFAQNPYIAVGPGGEVYAAWVRYGNHYDTVPSTIEVIASHDFGASFGPIATTHELEPNTINDPPGSTRTYGMSDVSLFVDRSHGPYRGRVYLGWDEPAHFRDAPFGDYTAAVEVESGTFAAATPFVVGGKIRGAVVASPTGDLDVWKFSGVAGQTVVIRQDTSETGGTTRLMCQATNDAYTPSTYRTLAYSPGEGVVAGLPYTGDYYFVVQASSGNPPGSYVFQTAFDTPSPGDIGRDSRDEIIAHSDDGVSWSTPVRVNDSPAGFDGTYCTVTVDDEGRVYVSWQDFRSDACGDLSDVYTAASGDGGTTWGANRRVTDASSYWNATQVCNLYNRGTYHHLTTAGRNVYFVFPDARLGNTDVFMDASRIDHASSCPPDADAEPGTASAVFALSNEGSFDTPLAWAVTDEAGWLSQATPSPTGTQTLAANGGTLTVTATLALPSGCSGDSTIVRFVTSDPFVPGKFDTCATVVRCVDPTGGVPPGAYELAFAPPAPSPTSGPTRLRYSLSQTGPVRLELYSVTGARLRVLENGVLGAGPHDAEWDGRDESGRVAPAGAYFLKLDAEGRAMRRSLIVVK